MKEQLSRNKARELCIALGIEAPEHIRIEDIAWSAGLRIEEGGLAGAAARLTVSGGNGVIRIRKGDAMTPRGRFSIAHEIGHFLMHQQRMVACSDVEMADLHSDFGAEAQANIFASELLLPSSLIRPRCAGKDPSIDLAASLADELQVGLIASALRVVEISEEPCALLFADRKKIRWFRRGAQFHPWLNVIGPPHQGSVAAKVLRYGGSRAEEVVDTSCWLEDSAALDSNVELIEYVVHMPNLGGVLILLHLEGWDFEGE